MRDRKVLFNVLFLVFISASVCGQSGGQYELSWSTIDGGGGTSIGGPYVLTGTIGQADADWTEGGGYEVLGGFWPGGPLCMVDFGDFANFAEYWLEAPCSESNDWCSGADLNHMDDVDFSDLDIFVESWLGSCPVGWLLD
jgi:hypothetical protein